MSARLRAPVLTVDAAEMRKVDPRNVETLFGMWTVFSKCAEAMEEGRRYENLSWRLWNRETFCCTSPSTSVVTSANATPVPTTSIAHPPSLLPRTAPVDSTTTSATSTRSPSSSARSSTSSTTSPPSSLRSRESSHARTRRENCSLRRSRHRRASPLSPTADLPELSASVDSAISDRDDDDDDDDDVACESLHTTPLDIERPAIRRLNSFESRSRGQERHLTSVHLERMFSSIKARKELLPLHLSAADRTVIVRSCTAERSPLEAHQPSSRPHHMTINESNMHEPPAAIATISPPTPTPSNGAAKEREEHQTAADIPGAGASRKAVFVFGGSSGDDESSLEDHMRGPPAPRVPPRGALVDGSKPATATADRKQTSFSDEVVTRTIRDEALHEDSDAVTDDEADDDDEHATRARATTSGGAMADDSEVSESAIEDDDDDDEDEDIEEVDDSSDWDSITESGRSSPEEKPLFQRVDSTRTLTSRRSLLTNLLHQSQRADAFAKVAAAQSAPAPAPSRRAHLGSRSDALSSAAFMATDEGADEDDDDAVEDDSDDEAVVEDEPSRPDRSGRRHHHRPAGAVGKLAADLPRSRPIIMTTSNAHPPALSPRTTRRNMLATELTESLRKHLLWERAQKHLVAHAGLKRRHTAHDVARLQDYPQEPNANELPSSKNNSWNHYYYDLGLGQYHQKGW
ncbi:MAG: hypothetical protein M1823_000478 [Watsoniomyces obsoletus]|nr:MAG: hypothetical protein M1823_000478 [Watsoniomyces obsoletus]